MRAHLRARTRFFDAQVLAALGPRTDQAVILGAGYDDRALRFPSPGADPPRWTIPSPRPTSAIGSGVLGGDRDGSGPGAGRLPDRDDVAGALDRAGHRADRPTLVLAEGLLIYLEPDAGAALLRGVRARAAPGSALAASLAVHPEGVDSALATTRANAGRPRAQAEPWRTIMSPSAHLELVERSGWRVAEAVDDASLDDEAVPGRSLLVVAHP